MRGHARERLIVVEIIGKLGAGLGPAFDELGVNDAMFRQVAAQRGDQVGVFGEALHQDLARTAAHRAISGGLKKQSGAKLNAKRDAGIGRQL